MEEVRKLAFQNDSVSSLLPSWFFFPLSACMSPVGSIHAVWAWLWNILFDFNMYYVWFLLSLEWILCALVWLLCALSVDPFFASEGSGSGESDTDLFLPSFLYHYGKILKSACICVFVSVFALPSFPLFVVIPDWILWENLKYQLDFQSKVPLNIVKVPFRSSKRGFVCFFIISELLNSCCFGISEALHAPLSVLWALAELFNRTSFNQC